MRTYSTYRRSPALALLLPPASVSAVALRFGLWLVRCIDRSRQRAQLADLDQRLLEDIGVTHAEAKREVDKPFWM
jgi:uncharacterized protein YjiS (DUF1127 family)